MIAEDRFIQILHRYVDVEPFLATVSQAADSDKHALGFLPSGMLKDFADKEQLIVAVERNNDGSSYAGHLLFEARHPKGRVLQVFVAPAFRKRQVAASLLNHLKRYLTEHAFISIYARVAEDLIEANRFWENQGFYIQRVTRGGETKNRTIFVRSHELDTPQLFASSGFNADDPLGLNSTYTPEIPLFLLDLNVLFDLGPRRHRNEEVLDLFKMERAGSCRLALSTEITAELTRTASVGVTDPMQCYARIFPAFPPIEKEWDVLAPELASIVFPERHQAGTLRSNDVSDLRHLATAIHHRLSGLITNDHSILGAAAKLLEKYGIQVVSPRAFKDFNGRESTAEFFETGASAPLVIAPITRADEGEIHKLLSQLGVPNAAVVTEWAGVDSNGRVCYRYGVWSEDVLTGYLMWPKAMNQNDVVAHMAVDEKQPGASDVVRLMLGYLIEQGSAAKTSQIRLVFPSEQAQIREIASMLGFGGLKDQTSLTKLALEGVRHFC